MLIVGEVTLEGQQMIVKKHQSKWRPFLITNQPSERLVCMMWSVLECA